MKLPNRLKFFFAGPFLEWADERVPGRPYDRLLADMAPGSHDVLDLCGGTGFATRPLAGGRRVTVLDLSPELLRRATLASTTRGVMQAVRGDARWLPFGDASFDTVVCAFGFHELDQSGRDRALREAWRVLRPWGQLRVVDLDDARRLTRAFRLYLRASHNDETWRVLGDGLRRDLESCGFSIIKHDRALGSVLPFQVLIAVKPQDVGQ